MFNFLASHYHTKYILVYMALRMFGKLFLLFISLNVPRSSVNRYIKLNLYLHIEHNIHQSVLKSLKISKARYCCFFSSNNLMLIPFRFGSLGSTLC